MSNSPLVQYVKISPHRSERYETIKKITIHHMAGKLTVEECGDIFQRREASANYGIGVDGRIGMYVEEKDMAWASCSKSNDQQAVNIELANDQIEGEWHVSDLVLSRCIELVVDICRRNGIKRLNYTGDASGNLTMHSYFYATACPGAYLKSKFPYIAAEVNRRLDELTYQDYIEALPDRGYFLKGDGYKENIKMKDQIKHIQRFLNWALGLNISVSGKYGDATEEAVRDFQKAAGIAVDGSWGKNTLAASRTFTK